MDGASETYIAPISWHFCTGYLLKTRPAARGSYTLTENHVEKAMDVNPDKTYIEWFSLRGIFCWCSCNRDLYGR